MRQFPGRLVDRFRFLQRLSHPYSCPGCGVAHGRPVSFPGCNSFAHSECIDRGRRRVVLHLDRTFESSLTASFNARSHSRAESSAHVSIAQTKLMTARGARKLAAFREVKIGSDDARSSSYFATTW